MQTSPLIGSALRESRAFRVLILMFGRLTTVLAQLVSVAILARVLDKAEHATYYQSLLVFTTFSSILELGLSDAMYVLYPKAKRDGKTRAIVLSNQIMQVSVNIGFAVFLLVGGNAIIAQTFNNPQLAPALNYIALYFITMIPLTTLDSVLLISNRTIQLVLFRIFTRSVSVIGIILFAVSQPTATSALTGLSLTSLISYLIGFWLMWQATEPGEWRPRLSLVREQMIIGLPLFISILFGAIQSNLDKIIVSIMDVPKNFIVFAVGTMQLSFINLFTSSLTEIVLADSANLFRDNRLGDVAILFWRVVRNNMITLLPTMLFFMATADITVPLIFSETYAESVSIFQFYLLTIPARLVTYSSFEIASGKTYLVPTVFISNTILTVILTVTLYPAFGYYSAIFSYLAVTYLFSVPVHLLVFVFILRLPLLKHIPTKDILKILTAIAASSLVFMVRPLLPAADLVTLVITGTLYGGALLLMFWLLRIQIPLLGPLLARAKRGGLAFFGSSS